MGKREDRGMKTAWKEIARLIGRNGIECVLDESGAGSIRAESFFKGKKVQSKIFLKRNKFVGLRSFFCESVTFGGVVVEVTQDLRHFEMGEADGSESVVAWTEWLFSLKLQLSPEEIVVKQARDSLARAESDLNQIAKLSRYRFCTEYANDLNNIQYEVNQVFEG